MNASVTEPCFTIALYGAAISPVEMVPLIGQVDRFLKAAGQEPTHLSIVAPGFGKLPLRFEPAWKRLQRVGSAELEYVSAVTYVEGWQSRMTDWRAICSVDARAACVVLGAGLGTMTGAAEELMAFIRDHLGTIRPAYGIGFVRERGLGPTLYAYGIGYGPEHPLSGPDHDESLRISRWSYEGRHEEVWRGGILRDVYPYNLLNQAQLERDIDGRSLGAWIRAGRTRGTLEAWPADLVLWTVPVARIDSIRTTLARSGALFAYQAHGS